MLICYHYFCQLNITLDLTVITKMNRVKFSNQSQWLKCRINQFNDHLWFFPFLFCFLFCFYRLKKIKRFIYTNKFGYNNAGQKNNSTSKRDRFSIKLKTSFRTFGDDYSHHLRRVYQSMKSLTANTVMSWQLCIISN